MKNLKDEIEEMIMQYSKELLTIRDTHNVPWLLNECTKASNVFAEALTSLIQQEREKAVRDFVGTIRLNGYSIENRFESPPENKMSVFVMLELMITAMYNYFGKHLAKESKGQDE